VPRPDLSVAIGTPNACTQCHDDQSAEWADRTVRDWYGDDREAHYGQVLHAGRSGIPTAGGDLSRLAVDATQPAIVRATALTLLAGYQGADLSNILGRTLADSDAIVRLGAVRASEGLPPDERYAILSQHLDDPVRSVRDEIGRVLAPLPATSVRSADRASVDRAIAGHIESQLVNGDRAESHFNLSNTYAGMRRLPAADSALQRALALDSTLIPAYVNLAELRRVQGRDIEGETILRTAVGLDPNNAFARHALGLVLVRLGQSSEALGELALAEELAPANARFAYVYGVALHSSGEPDRAYDALEEASTRHPNDLDILQMLLSIDQERADVEAAVRHLRRILEVVPNDPNAQELLDRLLAAGN
jgi:tetratricopeptide (TPR) repeat protein